MVDIARTVLEFLLVFLLVYLCYYFISYRKIKNYSRKKAPVGINYLVYKYNLDVVKLGYKRVFKSLMMCDSFIIATLFVATKIIDNTIVRLVVSFILVFPCFAGVYHLLAKYYKKKENE